MEIFNGECQLDIWVAIDGIEADDEDEAIDIILNMSLKDLLKERVESFDIVDWNVREVDKPNKVSRKRLTIAGFER